MKKNYNEGKKADFIDVMKRKYTRYIFIEPDKTWIKSAENLKS